MKIISTVPSLTELLFDLGLDNEVAGITKFCVHPNTWLQNKTKVGGTKNLKLDKIRELNPDFILANKEENTKEQIEILQQQYNVIVTDIKNPVDCMNTIMHLGEVFSKHKKAQIIAGQYQLALEKIRDIVQSDSCIYLIWKNPYMTVGGDTYIHSMLDLMGFKNLFGDKSRYPQVDAELIKNINPEYILLSSEPFPFTEKHIKEFQNILPNTKTILVDGEFFSWYGSRIIKMNQYIAELAEIFQKP